MNEVIGDKPEVEQAGFKSGVEYKQPTKCLQCDEDTKRISLSGLCEECDGI